MGEPKPAYLDTTLPVKARVDDLVGRMTLEEKVSQMVHDAPAIERLDIPKYNWWSEGLHGVAYAEGVTVFPQAIGLGATWNTRLMREIATAISDEARAVHHECARKGNRDRYKGLTYWSPNMLVATPKHFAGHSGPEMERHRFDARIGERDMRDTYLPAFEACVKEGRAASVMGAYNRTNGEPCCASPTLLQKILREEWGFDGYVVSDCWAIGDIFKHHKVVETPEEAAALAVRHGCDLNCGEVYPALVEAVKRGLIT
ncbi:MAG: glycoside hydrolase family 3 protein, partial [Planctomycetota bacterium]